MFSGYHHHSSGSRKRFLLPDHMPYARRAYDANRWNRWASHAQPNLLGFRTRAQRVGKVVRVRHSGVKYWQVHEKRERVLRW